MGLLKTFGKSMLDTMKRQVSDLQKQINEITLEDVEREADELIDKMSKTFDSFKAKVKAIRDKFTIEVEYDRDTQLLSYKIDDGETKKISITVEPCMDCQENLKDEVALTKSETVVNIPKNVSVDKVVQKYNAEEKKMIFIFNKTNSNDIENIEISENTETVTESHEPNEEMTKSQKIDKALEMFEQGLSYRKIASELGVSDKTIARWVKLVRE